MVMVEFLGQLFQVVNGAGTTPEGSLALRKAPDWAGASSAEELVQSMSPAQLEALTTMADWAETGLEGVTGTTTLNGRTVPAAAAKMAQEFRGADFGGRSVQEQRRVQKARRIDVNDIEAAMAEANVAGGNNGMEF